MFSRGKTLTNKELKVAVSDLEQAKISLKGNNYKWATIQCYYSRECHRDGSIDNVKVAHKPESIL